MPEPPPPHPLVRLLDQEKLRQGKFFDVERQRVELPSGLYQDWELISHAGATAIAALDSDGQLLLVKQYRASVGDWTIEIPAGRLEENEAPLECAKRELEEETGFRARCWSLLRVFLPATGFCTEVIHLFQATELEAIPGGGLECDSDEELEILWLAPHEVAELDPADGKTLIAALLVRT